MVHPNWEIIGTHDDYTLKPWLDLQLGDRSLNVSCRAEKTPLGFNVHEKGPIIAASLRL